MHPPERRQLFPFVLSKRVSKRTAFSYADGKSIFEIRQTVESLVLLDRASLRSLNCETSLRAIDFEDPVVGTIDLEQTRLPDLAADPFQI